MPMNLAAHTRDKEVRDASESEMVLNRDCAVQKSAASGEAVGSPPLLQAIQV